MTAPIDSVETDATRGRSPTRPRHHIKCRTQRVDPPASACSTTDAIPRSLSPGSRASKYAAEALKAYRTRLQWHYMDTGGFNEPPGIRCVVTSMPYSCYKLGLSGYYSGNMDTVSKLPDGEGVLCCHDGTRLGGYWNLGELQDSCPVLTRHFNVSVSSLPCDTSTCSSLSASVTRHASRDARETKKVKIPKNFVIITNTPMQIHFHDKDDVEGGILKAPRSALTRLVSKGNASEQTEWTSPCISRTDSFDSGKYGDKSTKSLAPFGVVSKVKASINSIRRRV